MPAVELKCNVCGSLACKNGIVDKKPPAFCPMLNQSEILEEARDAYRNDERLRQWALHSARTEAAGYGRDTRIAEIIAFAKRISTKHLGIACCVGAQREARIAQEIFEAHGLRVSTVACKVGSIAKEEVGLRDDEKVRPGQFEAICNPVAQAKLLQAAGTEFNVLIGLCVGHDSLFFEHSSAPVTVLVAKDRVTGHNPAAALYTSHSYYRKLKEPR